MTSQCTNNSNNVLSGIAFLVAVSSTEVRELKDEHNLKVCSIAVAEMQHLSGAGKNSYEISANLTQSSRVTTVQHPIQGEYRAVALPRIVTYNEDVIQLAHSTFDRLTLMAHNCNYILSPYHLVEEFVDKDFGTDAKACRVIPDLHEAIRIDDDEAVICKELPIDARIVSRRETFVPDAHEHVQAGDVPFSSANISHISDRTDSIHVVDAVVFAPVCV